MLFFLKPWQICDIIYKQFKDLFAYFAEATVSGSQAYYRRKKWSTRRAQIGENISLTVNSMLSNDVM